MKCECGGRLDVVSGRPYEDGYWRRMKCVDCGVHRTSLEQFCTTMRGNNHKRKQVEVTAENGLVVVGPEGGRRRKQGVPVKPASKSLATKLKELLMPKAEHVLYGSDNPLSVARNRVEDMKAQRELENLDKL